MTTTSEDSVLSLSSLSSAPALESLLVLLFEPSTALRNLLVPSVLLRLTARSEPPSSYNELIDICQEVSSDWTWDEKAEFISGHPMIGEVKGLSKLSGKEQGNSTATPKVVLDRLAHLNELYCTIFPGLRYITFVNGRSRAAIIPEFESILNLPLSPQPLSDDFSTNQPSLDSEEVKRRIKLPESDAWKKECKRGLGDVWLIGRARLKGLGLQ
ncbi:hypothetical protein I204_00536 [Kwoniella mangroviensis CBS 8886]|uniref:uncharacterized protein n=1 Tax=Kwoniella mangroviensis CBS 8507 TaxID=1296122 RepID=UPI00080CF3A4|nr:uncharacterized protein I203_06825 [Kwoniella mangroviensis CBS 8507]OCF64241.1 hypothetical protein I203_06825 [Kwoniella mangroviensis CBS 8507]OCF78596.1 hypothetical protein I204_00536 [Kwoniella mangroviensis CBS 8886]